MKSKQLLETDVVLTKVLINISYRGVQYYLSVTAHLSLRQIASVKADSNEKQIAYIARILQENSDKLIIITEGFKHYRDVRLYLCVSWDPENGAKIYAPKGETGTKKICGHICSTDDDGTEHCATLICPVDENGECDC